MSTYLTLSCLDQLAAPFFTWTWPNFRDNISQTDTAGRVYAFKEPGVKVIDKIKIFTDQNVCYVIISKHENATTFSIW